MCGTDIPVPECQLAVHQPTLKEIALIGETDFFIGVQTLCVNKSLLIEDKAVLGITNNFQIFMMIMSEKTAADKKNAVQLVSSLFFPKHKLIFTPRGVMLKGENDSVMLDENNFEALQEAISKICCLRTGGPGGQEAFNPADAKAEEIARKLMRGRQKVAEQKGENNVSVFSQYLSILTVGLNSMSMNDIMNLTMYQVYDLIERYSLYISWDIDIRSRLAGGKPDNKPDDWMKNIH